MIIAATRIVGNECKTYAGPAESAPAWTAIPGTTVRVEGVVTTVAAPKGTTCTCYYNEPGCPVCPPTTGWGVCSTGRENCRDICCR